MGERIPSLIALLILLGTISACGNLPARESSAPRDEVRYQVVMTAAAMLGTPYLFGGNSPDDGFDCSGLVQYSYAQAGVSLPRTTMELFRESRHIRLGLLKPGDVLFFKLNGKRVSHIAIYLGNKRFIHAPKTGRDVSIASLNNHYWRKRLVSAARML